MFRLLHVCNYVEVKGHGHVQLQTAGHMPSSSSGLSLPEQTVAAAAAAAARRRCRPSEVQCADDDYETYAGAPTTSIVPPAKQGTQKQVDAWICVCIEDVCHQLSTDLHTTDNKNEASWLLESSSFQI